MLLKNKIAVVYGAGGGVGSAIARKFALEGAQVYLTGRRIDSIKKIAAEISNSEGAAKATELDALDEKAIEAHLDSVIAEAGKIDISFNAVGVPASLVAEKGCSADGYSVRKLYAADHNLYPHQLPDRTCSGAANGSKANPGRNPDAYTRACPHGVPLLGGMAPAWAAMEALCRSFSAEFASDGIRALCLRTTGIPETKTIEIVFGIHAKVLGIDWEQARNFMESNIHARRSSTLEELTNVAAFLASDLAKGMTSTTANLTLGKAAD
jgi:NAD(P)-dependent dehydrogenase (short-subunit alcohol dehydrogenase family)